MSSSWPLALAITILVTGIVVFGPRFVPERWRRERRVLTMITLAVAAFTTGLLVIVTWMAIS
ncbi:MAG: hypothetical protein ABI466_00260 [Chloroflexota bacterium]